MNVGHGSSAQAAFLTQGRKTRWEHLKDSNLSALQCVLAHGTLSLCLCWGRKKDMWLGMSRMRFLMLRSVRKILRCLSGAGRYLRYKCCFAFIEVVLCLHKQGHSELGHCGFVVLVPLKSLTDLPALFQKDF